MYCKLPGVSPVHDKQSAPSHTHFRSRGHYRGWSRYMVPGMVPVRPPRACTVPSLKKNAIESSAAAQKTEKLIVRVPQDCAVGMQGPKKTSFHQKDSPSQRGGDGHMPSGAGGMSVRDTSRNVHIFFWTATQRFKVLKHANKLQRNKEL